MEIQKRTRRFLPFNLEITTWEDLKTYFEQLDERTIVNAADLEDFIFDVSEVEAVLEEEAAWRYIKMTIDTTNEEHQKAYQQFTTEIQPHLIAYGNNFNQKIHASDVKHRLPESQLYKVYFRNIENELKLFNEKNIPLKTELSNLSREFGSITGKMTIEHDGKTLTMQQAGKLMQSEDRGLREAIYHKMGERRLQDQKQLDDLFDKLLAKRHQVAVNAGFDNYRDYRFKELGRFDYTPEDCENFHASVQKHFLPLVGQLQKNKKEALGLDVLRPWDLNAEPKGIKPLAPFKDGKDLLNKSVEVFEKTDAYFGDCLQTLGEMNHLDLESKEGKSPGGYNYPLYEIGVPFIFMNAVGTHDDMITLMHEGGHAVHNFISRHYKVTGFKSFPSEVAELASMSTELITMSHWDVFYPNSEDLKRAKWKQLERCLEVMPWVALIDHFQHWLYTNVGHTAEERKEKWLELFYAYASPETDFSGLEEYVAYAWQKQLHLFEVPFYYIEYGMAQLGAIGVWKNYLRDNQKALYHFKQALEAGNTFTIPEIYDKAKIKFDFSDQHMQRLAQFVEREMKKI